MSEKLDHQIHVLSSVKYIKDHQPEPKNNLDKYQKANLSLLDHISLLLVNRAGGDVAAVMMEQTVNGLKFFYSKNSPSSQDLKQYLDNMLGVIANSPDLLQMQRTILYDALKFCREKFQSRVKKCKQASASIQKLALILTPENQQLVTDLSKDALPHIRGLNPEEYVTKFLCMLEAFDLSTQALTTQTAASHILTREAYILGIVL